ncbi:MAG: efflux RND transporter periplasmic adaptor subunit [Muribaculaceae bacterium]|nr:efflux RND transporter periplasmic adaptor subunit [Muribaculaceae bacterium]
MNLKLISALTLSGFLAFVTVDCSNKATESEKLRSVILTSPVTAGTTTSTEYSGVIEEGRSTTASFMADGKILKILVKEGDRVRKGQLIAVLDDKDYQIGASQLKTQFDQMTHEKERMDEMYRRQNIAPNDYEKFIAGYEQLKLQMEMMNNKLEYTKLYSPSNGYVAEKFMEVGELTGAGTPIFKITDDTSLTANVALPVSMYLQRNKIKGASGITPALPDTELPLSIESFTPDAGNNMLYQMKLLIPSKYNATLSPGMNIRVKLNTIVADNEGMEIPVRAIFEQEGKNYVWVYNPSDSTINKKPIVIEGLQKGKAIEVKGLEENDKIVETGVKQLYEGEKVNVAQISDYGL